MKPKIGIIGGSGLYDAAIFKNIEQVKIVTPYGPPSSMLEIGDLEGVKVAFLSRHSKGHTIPAHKVNYRANIWALHSLGIERILSVSAVGSLKEDYRPGELVIPDQFIDFTKKRNYTFYDGGKTVHISTADPFCPELSKLAYNEAIKLGIATHNKGTYICIEGPRFSTRAESRMFRNFADIIGMTLVPEAPLARELELCYISLTMVTDYDVWAEKPVSIEEILKTMNKNVENIKKLLINLIPKISEERTCDCKIALKFAEV